MSKLKCSDCGREAPIFLVDTVKDEQSGGKEPVRCSPCFQKHNDNRTIIGRDGHSLNDALNKITEMGRDA